MKQTACLDDGGHYKDILSDFSKGKWDNRACVTLKDMARKVPDYFGLSV